MMPYLSILANLHARFGVDSSNDTEHLERRYKLALVADLTYLSLNSDLEDDKRSLAPKWLKSEEVKPLGR